MPFSEARDICHRYAAASGITTSNIYSSSKASEFRNKWNLPSAPDKSYSAEWTSWEDYLGVKTNWKKTREQNKDLRKKAINLCKTTSLNYRQIAEQLGLSPSYQFQIQQWCVKFKARKKQIRKRTSKETREEIKKMCGKMSRAELAKLYGLSASRIGQLCIEVGHGVMGKKQRGIFKKAWVHRKKTLDAPDSVREQALILCKQLDPPLNYGEIAKLLSTPSRKIQGQTVRSWCLKEEIPYSIKKAREKFIKMCQKHPHWDHQKIADTLKIDVYYGSKWCKEDGCQKGLKYQKYTKAQKDKVISLCNDSSLTYKDISEATGVGFDSVVRICQKTSNLDRWLGHSDTIKRAAIKFARQMPLRDAAEKIKKVYGKDVSKSSIHLWLQQDDLMGNEKTSSAISTRKSNEELQIKKLLLEVIKILQTFKVTAKWGHDNLPTVQDKLDTIKSMGDSLPQNKMREIKSMAWTLQGLFNQNFADKEEVRLWLTEVLEKAENLLAYLIT